MIFGAWSNGPHVSDSLIYSTNRTWDSLSLIPISYWGGTIQIRILILSYSVECHELVFPSYIIFIWLYVYTLRINQCRDRVIHFLALKPHRKVDLHNRLKKGKMVDNILITMLLPLQINTVKTHLVILILCYSKWLNSQPMIVPYTT